MGEKIDNAKNALTLFLKSLDVNTYYNVCMFGNTYKQMYSELQMYNEDNLNDTLRRITQIEANMGGTELLVPIQCLLKLQKTNIFLITDGLVTNTNQITHTIQQQKHSTTRLFTIGIGRDADRALCEQVAKYGAGVCNMIIDSSSLNETLINQYVLSKQEYYSDISFNFDNDTQTTINNDQYILPNTVYRVYTKTPIERFDNNKQIILTFKSSASKEVNKRGFCKMFCLPTNKLLKRAYVNALIKNIDNGYNPYKEDLERLSIDNHIMCSKTSFVITDTDHVVTNKSEREVLDKLLPTFSMKPTTIQSLCYNDMTPKNMMSNCNSISTPTNQMMYNSKSLGINTINESLKIPNMDLRPTPPCPKFTTSPWMQSSITPDTNVRSLYAEHELNDLMKGYNYNTEKVKQVHCNNKNMNTNKSSSFDADMYDHDNLLPQESDKDWFETIDKPVNFQGRLLRLENPLGIDTAPRIQPTNINMPPEFQSTIIPDMYIGQSTHKQQYPLFNPIVGVTNIYSTPMTINNELERKTQIEKSFEPTKVKTNIGLNLDNYEHNNDDVYHPYYRPLPKTVDELRKSNKPTLPSFDPRGELKTYNIINYQNFDGSFTMCTELLCILNTTSEELFKKANSVQLDITQVLNDMIKKYLEKRPEYVLILQKFNKYLKNK